LIPLREIKEQYPTPRESYAQLYPRLAMGNERIRFPIISNFALQTAGTTGELGAAQVQDIAVTMNPRRCRKIV
jgi:hypothetical protein